MTIQILVMGPGHVWRDEMVQCLRDEEMGVRTLDSESALARAITTQAPDVILLSDQFTLGRMQSSSVESLTLLQQAAPRVPVIMLGTRADSMERIICLECGADDYMDMPCHPRELLSRIRNILRYRPRAARSLVDRDGDCAFGDFVFNRSRQHLSRNGVTVALQDSAMSLLGKLAENPMKVLSRQALIEMVNQVNSGLHCAADARASSAVSAGLPSRVGVGMRSGMNNGMNNGANGGANGGTARSLEGAAAKGPIAARRGGVSCERSLDVVVCRLRRVIEVEPSRPKFLQTVRGFGYVFNPSGGGTSARAPDVTANATANVTAKVTTRQLPHSRQSQPVHHSHQSAQHQEAIQNTVRRAAANADTARSINPWFSAISFPMQYPASEDLGSRSPA